MNDKNETNNLNDGNEHNSGNDVHYFGHCDDDCDYDGADDFDAVFTFDSDYDVVMILTLTMMPMLVLMVMMMTLIMTGTVTMKIKGGVFDEDDYGKTEHLVFCSVTLVISIENLSTRPNPME